MEGGQVLVPPGRPSGESDQDLIEAHLAGRVVPAGAPFDIYVERHKKRVWAYVVGQGVAHSAADDIVNAVFFPQFEAAIRKAADRREPNRLLFNIAHKRAVDWLRQSGPRAASRATEIDEGTIPDNDHRSGMRAQDFGLQPSELCVLRREIADLVIASLSKEEQEVFDLMRQGYSHEEIAERLQCPSVTVRVRYLRMARKLRTVCSQVRRAQQRS